MKIYRIQKLHSSNFNINIQNRTFHKNFQEKTKCKISTYCWYWILHYYASDILILDIDIMRILILISKTSHTLLSAVQKLSGVHALRGNEQFLACLELVRVTEVYYRQWSTSAGIMDDFLKNNSNFNSQHVLNSSVTHQVTLN